MRKTTIWFAALSVSLLGLVGCPEDSGEGDEDATADAAQDTQTPPEDTTGEDVPEDTGKTGDDATDSDDGPTDTGQDSGGEETGPGDDARADSSTDGGINRDVLPSSFGSGSFIDSFYIDEKSKNPSPPRCCFDITGDGSNDNAIADLLEFAGSLGAPIDRNSANARLNRNIQAGNVIFLFEYKAWSSSNWKNDTMIDMFTHPGKDAQSPFSDNLAGNGDFEILPKSYDQNGNPRSKFASASTSSAKLDASGGTLVFPLDFGQGFRFTAHLTKPKLTADVKSSATVGPGGRVPLENGKVGGALPKGDFYEGINNATNSCSCLGGQKLITPVSAPDNYQCNSPSGSCSCGAKYFINNCSRVTSTVSSYSDVDTNNNGTNDALTMGAQFTAVGAKIVGVAP